MAELDTVTRESTPKAAYDQLVNYVLDLKEHSERHFTGIRRELPSLYNLYRGVISGRFSPHKNDIHIPLIFSTIQSDVARKTQTSFGTPPFLTFEGYGPDDAPIARKREALIQAQMKDLGIFQLGYEIFLGADLYGTSVARWGWDHREMSVEVERYDQLPLSGRLVRVAEKKETVTFDGPNLVVKDLLDFFPQPGYRSIDDMAWCCEKDYMDFDEIRALAEIEMGGGTFFDPAEVRRMQTEGLGTAAPEDDYKSWRVTARSQMEEDARGQERYARPVELITFWGRVPSELAPDGFVDRVITVANERYLLRNRPLPFWNGRKPFLAFSPMPDPHYFFAPGKAEIARKLQILANRFTNQQLDALEIYIDPIFFVNQNMNLDTRNLFLRPGKFIDIDGSPQENIMPLMPNLQGLQMGGMMTETAWRWMQQGSGIVEDTVMGGSGNRQTAREFLGRSEAVATRLLMESRLFEENFLEPLGDTFVDLNRQFLEQGREVFILGQSAEVDPVTNQPVPNMTREMVEGWDLVPNYEAKAIGSITRLSKSQRQQSLTFLIQAMSQNPLVASAVNWINFARQVMYEFEIPNINEMIATPQEMMGKLQAGQAAPTEAVPGSQENLAGAGVETIQ